MKTNLSLAWLVLVLSACTVFQPKTAEEQVGAAYSTIIALSNAASMQVEARRITPEQGSELLEVLIDAKHVTDLAKQALSGGRPADALGYLGVVSDVLTQIEDMLRERT